VQDLYYIPKQDKTRIVIFAEKLNIYFVYNQYQKSKYKMSLQFCLLYLLLISSDGYNGKRNVDC